VGEGSSVALLTGAAPREGDRRRRDAGPPASAVRHLLPFLAQHARVVTYAFGPVGSGPLAGLGTDLVERARIAAALGEARFRETICGPREIEAMDALASEDAVSLAGRVFAAKESLLKALGPARCRDVAAPDLEIVDEDGRGVLRPGGRALALLRRLGVDWMEVAVAELPSLTLAVAAVGTTASLERTRSRWRT
jgi:phosphopantetheine--protein transferase-like protein